jgi:CRISPR-associated protein Cas5d
MNNSPPLEVKVWGEYACFTRPEMKVERVTYPVMTPSAARGILEAIFWKPEFQWRVQEIWVLKPIKHFSILRNEINSRQSHNSEAAQGGRYFADEDRAQRHSLVLRDVAYLIKADVEPIGAGNGEYAKYRDCFRRRTKSGQCLHRPYLGCREFAANFCAPDGTEVSIPVTDDLGLMLFDLDYRSDGTGGEPRFFNARLVQGVLKVPPDLYERRAST